jgi:hypothetical protein
MKQCRVVSKSMCYECEFTAFHLCYSASLFLYFLIDRMLIIIIVTIITIVMEPISKDFLNKNEFIGQGLVAHFYNLSYQ